MKTIYKNIPGRRITPTDGHYFFGYYDLQPFDLSGKKHLVHKTSFMDRLQDRGDTCEIGFVDTDKCKFERLETTKTWNFQQGAMLQWNPKAPDREIIYNDLVDYQQVAVIMDIYTGKKRYLDRPVANVSADGKYALSINMSRLFNFRPGYGYPEPGDAFYYENHSKDDGVFLIDMESGKSKLVLSLDELWDFCGSFYGMDKKMIINHINFNTDASRFVMLFRDFPQKGTGHKTAVITANRDGSDLYLLSDFGVQSHYYWIDEKQLIIFGCGKELDVSCGLANNYILTDKTHEGTILADGCFYNDNHMSFSPDRQLMITDGYPGYEPSRTRPIFLYSPEKNVNVELGRYYSMKESTTDIRCDLHPRWNRTGDIVTFDSTHEEFRGVYLIDLPKNITDTIFDE